MGARDSIASLVRNQAEAATTGRERAERSIQTSDMYFEPPFIGDVVMRHVYGILEDTALGIELLVSSNTSTTKQETRD